MSKQLPSQNGDDTARTGGFRPIGAAKPMGLFRAKPHDDSRYLEYVAPDGFGCFMRAGAVRDMTTWGKAAGRSEVMGRLGGRQCRDRDGQYTVVEQATLSRGAHGGPGYIVADIAAQQALHDDFDKECRILDSIGWWHTHPGALGLFYSSVDRDNQGTWTDPDSIGIVLNPDLVGEGLKVFRGPKSETLNCVSDDRVLNTLRSTKTPCGEPKATIMPALQVQTPKAKVSRWRSVSRAFELRFGEVAAVSIAVVALFVAVKAFNAASAPPQVPILTAPAPVEVGGEPESTPPALFSVPAEAQRENTDLVSPASDTPIPDRAGSSQSQAAPADRQAPTDEVDKPGPPIDEEASKVPDQRADVDATLPGVVPHPELR